MKTNSAVDLLHTAMLMVLLAYHVENGWAKTIVVICAVIMVIGAALKMWVEGKEHDR